MNQILNMAFRMILRKVIGLGINKGIDHMARRKQGNAAEATPQDQARIAETRKRAKQALRMARRAGR